MRRSALSQNFLTRNSIRGHYRPLIESEAVETSLVIIDRYIHYRNSVLVALEAVKMHFEPVVCGGAWHLGIPPPRTTSEAIARYQPSRKLQKRAWLSLKDLFVIGVPFLLHWKL